MNVEWQTRAPEDAGDDSAWMSNLESGATYLHRECGFEVRTRLVGEWRTYPLSDES
jgi:hypothetical protein